MSWAALLPGTCAASLHVFCPFQPVANIFLKQIVLEPHNALPKPVGNRIGVLRDTMAIMSARILVEALIELALNLGPLALMRTRLELGRPWSLCMRLVHSLRAPLGCIR